MIEPHRIAEQFYNRPLLLTETTAQTISSFLLSRFDVRRGGGMSTERSVETVQAFPSTAGAAPGSVEIHSPRASRFVGEWSAGPDGRPAPYRTTADGTAIITIIGELVNRGAWIGASSGLVSFEGIKHQVSMAAKDPRVSAILLDIESPGGQATGAFETAALIRQVREIKPVIAVVNGMAASGGYAIAAAATRIVTIESGMCGHIGVVMLHLDFSSYLAKEGVVPTFIFAGDHKVDGNSFEPLRDSVRQDLQTEVDAFYGLFLSSVAAGRGDRLTVEKARATQARVYRGEDAVRAGVADMVGSFEDVVSALATPQGRAALIG